MEDALVLFVVVVFFLGLGAFITYWRRPRSINLPPNPNEAKHPLEKEQTVGIPKWAVSGTFDDDGSERPELSTPAVQMEAWIAAAKRLAGMLESYDEDLHPENPRSAERWLHWALFKTSGDRVCPLSAVLAWERIHDEKLGE